MEANHEIFVEGDFVAEDGTVTKKWICLQDAIKSMSYEKWVKPTLEKYGPAIKDLYILLVYYPWWTDQQRTRYLKEYRKEIIDAFDTANLHYLSNLHVTIGHNGSAVSYIPAQFISIKTTVDKMIEEEQKKSELISTIVAWLQTKNTINIATEETINIWH